MNRALRALLALYPASFRREYGAEMAFVLKDRLHRAGGPLLRLAVWLGLAGTVIRDAALVHWDLTRQDLRHGFRALSRTPGFTATAVLVTALGVGATTAAFSVADFVLLRPLPFPEPERLVRVWQSPPGYTQLELSPPNYHDWKAASRSFESMGAFHGVAANLVGEGTPRRLRGITVTPEVLPLLGVTPWAGRLLTGEDGDQSAIVLSHGLWQEVFGGAPEAIGRTVRLDGEPRVIAGVMPPGFHFPDRRVQFWSLMPPAELAIEARNDNFFEVVARLAPGVTVEQARSDLGIIADNLARQYPRENEQVGATVYRLQDGISNQSRMLLLGLTGASLCVLLIACANLANLLLARGLARHRELVVRTALGAGRERLVRQVLTESLMLAALGGGLGVLVAQLAVPLFARLVPVSLPLSQVPTVDWRVLLFAALLTGATGIAVGVLPALRASRGTDFVALREGQRGGGGRQGRLRTALVVVEVAASVVLLVSSGLLLRALWRIQATDPGFRAESVLTFHTALPMPRYSDVALRERFYTEVLGAVRAAPGVSDAAYISFLPMVMGGGIWPVVFDGGPGIRSGTNVASLRFATPGFFRTMGIPLSQGRDVAETDRLDQPAVAVVSESFVRRYWPDQDPLGKRFQVAGVERTIVGVAGDIMVRGLERGSEPQVYLPYLQVPDSALVFYVPKDLVVRTTSPMATVLPLVRRAVAAADPDQPVSDVQTLKDIVSDNTASRAVQARVLTVFAAVAVLLAAVGIHGLLSYAVSTRRHEISVRMALGADRPTITRMVLRQAGQLALAGVIPGVLVSYAAGTVLRSLLAGVHPADGATFGAAILLCVIMTLLGSLLPVLRAVKVEPAAAFRGE